MFRATLYNLGGRLVAERGSLKKSSVFSWIVLRILERGPTNKERQGEVQMCICKKKNEIADDLGGRNGFELIQVMGSCMDWDYPVGENLSKKATQWFDELSALAHLKIPRCLKNTTTFEEMTMRTFVDSSQEAYGAACYVRHLYKDGTV